MHSALSTKYFTEYPQRCICVLTASSDITGKQSYSSTLHPSHLVSFYNCTGTAEVFFIFALHSQCYNVSSCHIPGLPCDEPSVEWDSIDLGLGMEKYHQVERWLSWPQEMSPCLHSVLKEKKMQNFISLLSTCFSYSDMDNSTSPLFKKSQTLHASRLPSVYKSSQAELAPKQVQRTFLSSCCLLCVRA